jgi:GT2 family glycosyltransferase
MISVVILAYNRVEEVLLSLEKVTEFLADFPFESEIILVDNASVDNTSARVKQEFPDVKLITKVKNNGIAAWNDGFKVAKGQYFLVLDDDSHIEKGLKEAIRYLERNPDVGILALNIEGGPYLTDKVDDGQEVAGFVGCGAIIRRELYDKIGGFADWIFVYAHESEYGIRCLDAGYKIKFFKDSRVVHRASALNRTSKKTFTLSTRNEMMIIYRYFQDNKSKYLWRVFLNHFKSRFVNLGFSAGYYTLLGGLEFLKLKKIVLPADPVRPETQKFFVDNFRSTRPFFIFLNRWYKKN